jgi:hypothetical protein
MGLRGKTPGTPQLHEKLFHEGKADAKKFSNLALRAQPALVRPDNLLAQIQ